MIGRPLIGRVPIHRCEASYGGRGRGPNVCTRPESNAPHAETDDGSGTHADTGNYPLSPRRKPTAHAARQARFGARKRHRNGSIR